MNAEDRKIPDVHHESQTIKILELLNKRMESEGTRQIYPTWYQRTDKLLRYAMVASGALIFSVQALQWLGAIRLSHDTSPLLKWPLLAVALIGVVVAFVYQLLGLVMTARQFSGKRLQRFVGEQCRADALLIANLAQLDELPLASMTKVTLLREGLFRDREGVLLGFLSKVPVLVIMLAAGLAFHVEVVELPESLKDLTQFLPVPLTGYWLSIVLGLFTAMRMQMFYARESARFNSSLLNAALETRKLIQASRVAAVTAPVDHVLRAGVKEEGGSVDNAEHSQPCEGVFRAGSQQPARAQSGAPA